MRSLLVLLMMTFFTYRRYGSLTEAVMDVWWMWFETRFDHYPRVNGVRASRAQLKLAEQLHAPAVNYKVGKRYIDVAFPKEKIAVEYNGALYHKDKAKDMKRAKELTRKGWKVLIIQVKSGFPDVRWVKHQIAVLKKYKRKKVKYIEWEN